MIVCGGPGWAETIIHRRPFSVLRRQNTSFCSTEALFIGLSGKIICNRWSKHHLQSNAGGSPPVVLKGFFPRVVCFPVADHTGGARLRGKRKALAGLPRASTTLCWRVSNFPERQLWHQGLALKIFVGFSRLLLFVRVQIDRLFFCEPLPWFRKT